MTSTRRLHRHRPRRLLVLAAALLAVLAAAGSAAAEDLLAQARRLLAEAEPFVKQSDDPDADDEAKKSARKEARRRLFEARDAYQKWQGPDESRDDPVGPEIAKLIYWVNKMSSVTEMGGRAPPPAPRPPTPPPGGDTPAPPSPPPGPGPAGSGDAPKPPAPPAAADPAQVAKTDFAALEAFEKQNKGDVPVLKDAYERFLADHPDPSLPEYDRAAQRLAKLQEELQAAFKRVVQRDPDELKDVDSEATVSVINRLKRDLAGKEPEARRRAARILGMTRSGAAAYSLALVLRDDDPDVARLAAESLVAIGGGRTGEMIVKKYRDASRDSQAVALDVLQRIARKSSVDAASVSFWIGRFVLSNNQEVAGQALDFLASLGPEGGPGLVEALETKMPMKKVQIMDAIGNSRYYRGARALGGYLLMGDGAGLETNRARASAAIQKLGLPAVPHLIPMLQNGRTKMWTALVLREMTGQRFSADNVKEWKEWYDRNRPKEDPKK